MELNDVLRALRTKRRYILAGLLVGLAVAMFLNWSAERLYASTTRFFVSVAASIDTRDPYGDQQFSQQRVISYVQMLTGRELAQGVVDDLGLPMTAAELSDMITATPLPDTVVLEVTVTDTTPERAQAIATSVGTQFVSRVRQLETPEGTASPTIEIKTLEPPSFEPTPVSPATTRTLALGAALGLLLGFGLALLRIRLDRSIRSEDEAAAVGRAELLGRVSVDRQLTRRHISSGTGQSAAIEAFRTIRVNLQHLDRESRPKIIVVAGAMPGDGASTVAVNLAVSLARSGSRVMLIDADLRRPRAARQLGFSSDSGLTDVLNGNAELAEVVHQWQDGTLTVLAAGPLLPDPSEALGSEAMRLLLKSVRDDNDYVIVDAPPLLPVIDAAVLAALADGCLVVARFARTTRDQLADATSAVTRVHSDVLGLVLNRVPRAATATRRRRKSYLADSDRRRPRRPVPQREEGEEEESVAEPGAPPEAGTAQDAAEPLPIRGTLPPLFPRDARRAEAGS